MDIDLTRQQTEDLMSEYSMDLLSFFKMLEEDALRVVMENQDRPLEDIISEIDKLF